MLIKAEGLPDYVPSEDPTPPNSNQPEVHEVYRSWRRLADDDARELVFVGEVWAPTAAEVADYIRPDELHQVFSFDLMLQPWHAASFRTSVETALAAVGSLDPDAPIGTLAWALNSHDAHRSVSRYGLLAAADDGTGAVMGPALRQRGEVDVPVGRARARAALLFLLGLPGGRFLYQGEELGLPEVMDLPEGTRQDPIWRRSGGQEYGRDGCRVPLPWTADAPNLGFSTGQPWLPQPEWFADYPADRQATDPGSMLSLYRAALAGRRGVSPSARLEWLDTDRPDVLAYRRGNTVVVTVFDGPPWTIPASWGALTLSSVDTHGRRLAGPASAWLSSSPS
jgi:alpha-glucosidase